MFQEAQIARLEAKISSVDRANQLVGVNSFSRTATSYDERSFERRLAEPTTVSYSALQNINYNQLSSIGRDTSNRDLMHASLDTETSHIGSGEDSQDRPRSEPGAVGELRPGPQVHNYKANENVSGYGETDPESLVGMYLEVKEQTGITTYPHSTNATIDADVSNGNNINSISNSSKIPKASGKMCTKSRNSTPSLRNKPPLNVKSNKLDKANGNAKKSTVMPSCGLPKLKSNTSASSTSHSKSKIATSKVRTTNYYPTNLYAAANAAKANIAKMMKTVDDVYTPSLDYHVSTYIQDISDVADLSDIVPAKNNDTAHASDASDSSNASDHINENQNSQSQVGSHDGSRCSVQSNSNYCEKSVSSLDDYESPGAGMCVSDSNLAVSSNLGTGTASDLEEEKTVEIAGDAASVEKLLSFSQPTPEGDTVHDDNTAHGHSSGGFDEDGDSDSSLEPGMQRAKLFVAVNQG